jgi:hypothetical protein
MNRMRDFSWRYFSMTGDVESFLLYKQMDQAAAAEEASAAAAGSAADSLEEWDEAE